MVRNVNHTDISLEQVCMITIIIINNNRKNNWKARKLIIIYKYEFLYNVVNYISTMLRGNRQPTICFTIYKIYMYYGIKV